jgi:hypothetical protein
MSAQDNLNPNQFVTLYRGVYGTKHVNNPIGIHWTPDKEVASHFALGKDYDEVKEPGDPNHGHIVEARVERRHVVPVGSEEWGNLANKYDILHPKENGQWENEHTLRDGTPLHITSINKIKENPTTGRTRTFRRAMDSKGYA